MEDRRWKMEASEKRGERGEESKRKGPGIPPKTGTTEKGKMEEGRWKQKERFSTSGDDHTKGHCSFKTIDEIY